MGRPGVSVDDRVVMVTTNTATCSSLNGSVPYSGSVCATSSYEYYHADRLGNVIAMVNALGHPGSGPGQAFTAQYVYPRIRGDKHARRLSRTRSGRVEEPYNTSSNPYRYTGRRLEPEWGIFHYRARYYDPALGRFLETDPVLYADQMNLYIYVDGNPLASIDPMGMTGCNLQSEQCSQLLEATDSARENLQRAASDLQAIVDNWDNLSSEQQELVEVFSEVFGADNANPETIGRVSELLSDAARFLGVTTFIPGETSNSNGNEAFARQDRTRNTTIITPLFFDAAARERFGSSDEAILIHEAAHRFGVSHAYDRRGFAANSWGAVVNAGRRGGGVSLNNAHSYACYVMGQSRC